MRRIRTRLMIVILVAALLPALPMSLVVRNLIERSMNPALQQTLVDGLKAGMEGSREELQRRKYAFAQAADRLWKPHLALMNPAATTGQMMMDEQGQWLGQAAFVPELNEALTSLDDGPQVVGSHLALKVRTAGGRPVVIAQALPPELVARADRITDAMGLLAAFQIEREPILRSYILPFVLVYAALILAALAVASVMAGRLARPLEAVAAGAARVAEGDLETRVDADAGGEAGALVRAFNEMVARLSQQRRELSRLEKAAAWRGMARTLAHEIKNPLTPILLAVQETHRSYRGTDENHREALATCELIVGEEVDGLRRLVAEFSDFARLPRPRLRDEDLVPLVRDLARLYGDRLKVSPAAASLLGRFDAKELRRALVNLIDNGLNSCAQAGVESRVTLSARNDKDGGLVLVVADGGVGIPPEHRDRIFEPDFSTRKEGMGLGLAIVDGIVHGHGGEIEIDSNPGAGAVFTLRIPAGGKE
ncbi:HAMP domain-containing protein [bacterium]|nr:HAMP domain-containing protein [bacterium]